MLGDRGVGSVPPPAGLERFVKRHKGREYLFEEFSWKRNGSYKVETSPGFLAAPEMKPEGTAVAAGDLEQLKDAQPFQSLVANCRNLLASPRPLG